MKTNYVAVLLSGLFLTTNAGSAHARSDDVISRGTIASITPTQVTVGTLTCVTNSGTEYENLQGGTISRSEFTVGDRVKLVCRGGSAHSLEMERNNGGGGSSSGSDDSSSGGGSNGGGGSEVRLKSRLNLIDGVASGAVEPVGKIEYRNKSNGSGRDDRFKITVKVPLPSVVPVADTLAEARALDLTAVLSRNATPYAVCTLGYDHRSAIKGSPAVEHKIELRYEQKGSQLRLKSSKGKCDLDPSVDGVQAGFPEIADGDTVVIQDSLAGEFLTGQF